MPIDAVEKMVKESTQSRAEVASYLMAMAWAQTDAPVQSTSRSPSNALTTGRAVERSRRNHENVRDRLYRDDFRDASESSDMPVCLVTQAHEAVQRVTTAEDATRSRNESNQNRR